MNARLIYSLLASAALALPATAREITALSVDSATHVATVEFTAGEAGDGHVLYYAWSDDAQDKGAALAAWPNVLRVTRVADDATSHSFELPDVAASAVRSAARAFLATSDRNYDNFVQGVTGGSAGESVYFETGVNPGPTTSIRVDAKFNSTTAQQYLFGISPKSGVSNDNVLTFAAYINGSTQWASALQDKTGDWQTTGVTANADRNIFSLDADSGVFSVVRPSDGTVIATSTHNTTRNITSGSSYKIVLFNRRTPTKGTVGSVGSQGGNATIYACSITNNGACVRDYVPAVRNGVVGLYDKVKNTFAGSNGSPTGAALTQAGGTVPTYGIDSGDMAVAASPVAIHLGELAIPFDAETTNATPVAVASTFAVPAGYVQPLALSSAITLPFHETLRLEVLIVAAGAADLSADNFADNTEKTYGLPNTTIAVEKDGDGVQHVFIVAKPVVKSVGNFSNDYNLNGAASLWSDGRAVHAGSDYLIVHSVGNMGNADFGGDSLTVCSDHVYTRTTSSKITKATIYAPTLIQQQYDTRDITVSGDIRIAGSFDDAAYVTFNEKYNNGHYHCLSAKLTGEGPLKVTGDKTGGFIYAKLRGDNSAYRGRIYVTNDGSPSEYTGTQLEFNSANALGGAIDEFRYNALTLDKFSLLCPTTTMTLETANRGIYGSGSFGFKVPDGVTLTVKEPIRAAGPLYKHGSGALSLGGEISFGAAGTGAGGTLYVREGAVTALDDAAVAGLDVVFSNATRIVLSPDATLVNGFCGTVTVLDDAETGEPGMVAVALADGFAPPDGDGPLTAVIATVPTSAGDLSSRFMIERLGGFAATVATESVTVGGVSCTRYSAKYASASTTIIFR